MIRSAAPLLVVYDAESYRNRRWVDRIQKRDRHGLIIAIPCQNPELVKIAPELAGHPLHQEVHGLDTLTRVVWSGREVLPQVWARLPGWKWVNFLTRFFGISKIVSRFSHNNRF